MLSDWLAISEWLMIAKNRAYKDTNVCPPEDLVFTALQDLSPERVRVVILGQDPYYTPGKANGRAFGYNLRYFGRTDSYMRNILKELNITDSDLFDTGLSGWAKQGVLLLNIRLTVKQDQPLSHAGLGWEQAVTDIIRHLDKRKDVVWLLWGREADSIAVKAGLDTFANNVIYTSHPSNLSAAKGPTPFIGSNCFYKANQILKDLGSKPIKWR